MLKIDPGTDSTSTFGDFSGAAAKWLGAVLSPNGHIYGLPSTATSVLKIDPYTDSATTFGDIAGGDYKWWGGVLAPNGAIYTPSRFFAVRFDLFCSVYSDLISLFSLQYNIRNSEDRLRH